MRLLAAMAPLPVEGEFPPLGGATGWMNSQPPTAAGLRGKVVLVDFGTYTCINWLRARARRRDPTNFAPGVGNPPT
jgi:hypothetical protein